MKKLTRLTLAVLLVASLSSCAWLAAGTVAGAFAYIGGELQRDYATTFPSAIEATDKALAELKIRILDKTNDGITCQIEARQGADTPVNVRIQTLAPKKVMIGVRVGRVGLWDRSVAETVHNFIKERL